MTEFRPFMCHICGDYFLTRQHAKINIGSRDGQKPEFFQNPGFGFNPGYKMKNPGFSG